ncbi:DUF6318 family protein [Nocardioides sp. DS6]|uniref:DUF6318 family protein n=1 Tax=Nocardioides eburneus TaxID=3231482 RepID=A0ABV3SWF8_9ACTN
MRRTSVAAVAVGALVVGGVSGCGGDPKPKFAHSADPSPSAVSSSAAPADDLAPPEMPEAAKAHTVAGAKAFVRYFWRAANYAQTTLDASLVASLASENCTGCTGGVEFVERVKKGRGTIRGGAITVGRETVRRLDVAGQVWMAVTYSWSSPRQVVDFPGTKKDEVYSGGRGTNRFTLQPVASGWRVALWETLK